MGHLILSLSAELLWKSQSLFQLHLVSQNCQRPLRVSGHGFKVLGRKHLYCVYQLGRTSAWTCISSCTFHYWEKWAEQLTLSLAPRQSESDWTGCPGSHTWQWWTSPQVPASQLPSSWPSRSSTCPPTATGQASVPGFPFSVRSLFLGCPGHDTVSGTIWWGPQWLRGV